MGNRKKFLFEHYRHNLTILRAMDSRIVVRPVTNDFVICPLCFDKYFTLNAVEAGHLTEEHAPPHKLGGKVNILTCKDCNNNQGAFIDKHLVDYIHHIDALSGKGTSYVNARVKREDGSEFRAIFRFNNKNWELFAIPKASNEKHIQSFTEDFLIGNLDFNLELSLPDERLAKLGLIRSAYLIAFQHLGYGFLLNFNLGVLRYQFQNPSESVYPIKETVFHFEFPDELLGVNILSSAIGKCYFVVFDVGANNNIPHRIGVVLPGPNHKDYAFFESIEEFHHTKITITHFNIGFNDKLKIPHLAHIIWDEVK